MKQQLAFTCSLNITGLAMGLFSRAEISILNQLINGKSIKEISTILRRKETTIQNEMQSMMHKINCHDRTTFLTHCLKARLIEQHCSTDASAVFIHKG